MLVKNYNNRGQSYSLKYDKAPAAALINLSKAKDAFSLTGEYNPMHSTARWQPEKDLLRFLWQPNLCE